MGSYSRISARALQSLEIPAPYRGRPGKHSVQPGLGVGVSLQLEQRDELSPDQVDVDRFPLSEGHRLDIEPIAGCR
jgi:hypothetical protein